MSALDYLGKRTTLFGMTRTGKSNTVKMIIQATAELAPSEAKLDGKPVEPVGQIIFDVNGEYANSNLQDDGTAIYELYEEDVTRYSILEKDAFKVMKLNFYRQVLEGFGMIRARLQDDGAIYTKAFLNVNWDEPDPEDRSATTRHGRRLACYQAILEAAGFPVPPGHRVSFTGTRVVNDATGLDQPDRQHPLGRKTEDPQGDQLEERSDGLALGCGLVRGDREELPEDHRLRPALDAQGPPRRP